jgi:acyl-CoA synthetase (AMP-forming)/AMP-acid ligase II
VPHLLTAISRWGQRPAIVTQDLLTITYEDLDHRLSALASELGDGRKLVLIEAKNELEPLLHYLACLRSGHPVMLVPADRPDIGRLLDTYRPDLHLAKVDGAWRLTSHVQPARALHPDLAVLLSTSGSTGTAKFVRLSDENIAANAGSIATYLELTAEDRAITTLPFHYSYGLSVVNSHLLSGATVLLTDRSVVEPEFWEFFAAAGATSIAAVPYTFELLDRVRFSEMSLPQLRCVTAAGGRVPPETVVRYARMARAGGWRLFAMYGQTEATARMAYVAPDLVEQFPAAIGRAIPGGQFELRDDHGATITEPGRTGELFYRGRNVMMGYATSPDDLATGAGLDELATGDLAQVDDDGVYSVVGRKSRFVKIFGLRLGLDELELRLAAAGYRTVLSGTDDFVAVGTLDRGASSAIRDLVCDTSTLPPHVIAVVEYDDYPLLANGKVDYARIRDDGAAPISRPATPSREHSPRRSRRTVRSIREAYCDVLRVGHVEADDTFVGLGGDSLSYIQVEMALETLLGYAPRDWHRRPVGELEKLGRRERRTRTLDMPIVLRAVAMTMVVAGHFGVFYLPGSSATLFAVAGLNFARFQLPAIVLRDSPRPALHALARIVVPTAIYTLAITLAYGYPPSIPITFLYSNLVDMNLNDGLSYWFIELLAQLVLVMAVLFGSTRMRRAVAKDPRLFGFGLLVTSLAMRVLGPFVWDADHLLNRVPHATLWLFALGWCVLHMRSTRDRLVLSIVALAVPPLVFDASSPRLMGMIGLTLLVWIDHVPVPRGVDRVLAMIATASLYIYLTHFEFRAALERMGITDSLAAVVVALVGGVVVARVADRAASVVSGLVRPSPRGRVTGDGAAPVRDRTDVLAHG